MDEDQEFCPNCGVCDGSCDNCPWCGTDSLEEEEIDETISAIL